MKFPVRKHREKTQRYSNRIDIYIYTRLNIQIIVSFSNKIPRFNFHDFKFVSTLSARTFVELLPNLVRNKTDGWRRLFVSFWGKKNRRKIFLQKKKKNEYNPCLFGNWILLEHERILITVALSEIGVGSRESSFDN